MIIVFILFVIVIAIILLPSQMTSQKGALAEVQDSLTIRMEQLKKDFQFRTKELARRLESVDLAEDEWQKMTDELQMDTRASIDSTQIASDSPKKSSSWLVSLILMIVVIGLTYVVYQYSGSYELVKKQIEITDSLKNDSQTIDKLTKTVQTSKSQEALTDLYLALRTKVELLPSNIYSWRALAMFNASYGRVSEARSAMDIAMDIEPDNVELKIDLAQILGQSKDKQDFMLSWQLIREVLKEQPENRDALLLLGDSSYQFGMHQRAIDTWEKLLATSQPGTAMTTMLEKRIEQAEQMLAGKSEISNSVAAKPAAHPPTTATSDARISVKMQISDSVRSRLTGNEGLFIFAKAVDGPRFPIVAVRTTVADLNKEIILTDANAMQAEYTLSKYKNVIVTARISFSGEPTARAGDIQGQSEIITAPFPESTITLVLDDEVK